MRARLLSERPVESFIVRAINSVLITLAALGIAIVAADGWGLISLFFK